jgi:CRP-like cAMP-binding protein
MGYAAGRNPTPAQLKKLLRIFSEDLRKNPGDLLLRLKLAEVLRLLGRFEEAVSLYGSVAWSYAVAGNLVQAIMLCKLILELKPEHQETQQMLAKLYASKRIREEKQSVQVVNVDGRWVADPRQQGAEPQPRTDAARVSGPTGLAAGSAATVGSPAQASSPSLDSPDSPDSPGLDSPGLDSPGLDSPGLDSPSLDSPSAEDPRGSSPSAGGLMRPPSMSGLGADLATQAAKARAEARREAARRSQAVLSGSHSVSSSTEAEHDRVTQVETPDTPDDYVGGPTGPLPQPAGSPFGGPTGPIRPISTSPTAASRPSARTSEARLAGKPTPLARVETSDDFEPLLNSPSGAIAQDPPVAAQLPEPPPVQSNLPPTFVGKSPLAEQPASEELHVGDRLAETHSDPAEASTPVQRKRQTMRLQTISTPGEAKAELLAEQPPSAEPASPSLNTGPMPRRGRSLRVDLEARGATEQAIPRATQGYMPPVSPGAGGFLPPTATPELSAPEPSTPEPSTPEFDEPSAVDEPSPVDEPSEAGGHRPTEVHDPVEIDRDIAVLHAEQAALEHGAAQPGGASAEEPATVEEAPATIEDPQTPLGQVAAADDDIADTAVGEPPALRQPAVDAPDTAVSEEPQRAMMLEPDGDAVEQIEGAGRQPKSTARMDTAVMSTLLRKDAELAYREAKSTDCYAAIQREVMAWGQQQDESALLDTDEQEAEQRLERTLQELPSHASQELPSGASVPEIPLFSDLGPEAFVALVERLEARLYDSGEFVMHEGEPGDSLLLVSAGRLQVLKGQPDAYIELALLGPGAFFGEFGLLTDQRRHASVRCVDDTEVLELRRDVLADLIRDHPIVQQTLRSFYKRRVLQMVLATSPLFRAVSPQERDAVIARFTTRRYVEGEVIVTEGEHAGAFYVILVGEVTVTCQDEDGADVQVGALSEGQYFGEMSLISGYPAEATVRAARVTEVLALDELAFYEMASTHPEIWAEVQRESQARAEANDRILAERRSGPLLL